MRKTIIAVLILVLCIGAIAIGLFLLHKESTRPKEGTLNRLVRTFEGRFARLESVAGPSVGLVRVFGPITFSESGSFFDVYPRGALRTVRELERFRENRNIKAIVIQINSPGGTMGGVQEICNQIALARQEGKKVVASIADMAFSGGYYIASACDEIVANPGSLTGSIGVILVSANMQNLFEFLGIKFNVIKSGKHKDIAAYWREMTQEERNLLQTLVMDCYGQFLDAVSKGRRIPVDELLEIADGRIFSGTLALEKHLIDRLGTLEDAVSRAGELSGIEGRPNVVWPAVDPFERFFRFLDAKLGSSSLREMLVGECDAPIQFRANLGPAEAAYSYPSRSDE